MFETYCSEHVYGFGRFFAIIAKTEHRFGVIAEIYLFASSFEGPIFDGVIVNIPTELVTMERDFVDCEAMMQAENMVQKSQYEAYKKCKDRDLIMNNPIVFNKVNNDMLISIKQTPEHAEHLREIAGDTKSAELSEYIQRILSYTFEIRPYKKGDK